MVRINKFKDIQKNRRLVHFDEVRGAVVDNYISKHPPEIKKAEIVGQRHLQNDYNVKGE